MLVLTGPPGSGKTGAVLSELRDSIRRHDWSVRLLVPSGPMAEYLRHQLAREGLAIRPILIQTAGQFAAAFVDGPEVTQAALRLATEAAVARLSLPEFARVADCKGFLPMLARAVEEVLSAGLAPPDTPLGDAVQAVAAAAAVELERRGCRSRMRRFAEASRKILHDGAGSIHTVWMDGFTSLAGPELELARALSRHANVTVSLPDGALIPEGCRVRNLETSFRHPAFDGFRAATLDREAAEIARRILLEVQDGRVFQDIGIIVRDRGDLPPIESALERFSIPYRTHAERPFSESSLGQFCRAVLDGLRSGWDHESVLKVLAFSEIADTDEFDFAVRRQLPGVGIEPLRNIAGAPLGLLDGLAGACSWIKTPASPEEWLARMRLLPPLMASRQPSEEASFDSALQEIEDWFTQSTPIGFDRFAGALLAALECTRLGKPERRRNVVHVLAAHEARHWELPVVFVCGLVEGDFPASRAKDPFLSDIRDHAAEERQLFDVAVTRATSTVTLSYARSDARGAANQPSRFLEGYTVADSEEFLVRPRPRREAGPRSGGAIRDPEGLAALGIRHASLHPSGVETYLRCPFQFFGRYALALVTRPARPEDRLDFKLQGTILHEALAASTGQPIAETGAIFDRVFRRHCAAHGVPPGYRTEFLRRQMIEDVRRFLLDNPFPPAARTMMEVRFELPLADPVTIRGRIDRIDIGVDGRGLIIDYKRTAPETDAPALAQAPLYALAAERVLGIRPAGVFYCGLRERVRVIGWAALDAGLTLRSEVLTPEWLDAAERAATDVAARIRSGRFGPAPVKEDLCPRCEYRDFCRYRGAAHQAAADGQ